jgi:hypothetical protein
MLKQVLTMSLIAGALSTVDAQSKFKFGVHLDPTISFMGSNDKSVTAAGSNIGLRFGVQGDLYIGESENYAITFGTGFVLGAGGTLKYRDGGRLLPNTDLDKSAFKDYANTNPSSGENLAFGAGTTVKYSVNYVPISAGFKITTKEFGQSFIRAFFHLPTIDILIPVSARGKISAGAGYTMAQDSSNYRVFYKGESSGENIYSDIVPLQIAAGLGAGVEWSPNEEGGIRLIGGIYYNAAVLDITKKVTLYDPLVNPTSARFSEKNPRSAFQNVSLRIGVIF